MKVRNDYVSNSSSSSFILANCEIFDYFNVTKQDILDALIDSYGKKEYAKAVERCKKAKMEYADYYKEQVKNGDFGPFYVYDLNDKNDRKKAEDMWGNLLKGWLATNCHLDGKGKKRKMWVDSEPTSRYEDIMELVEKVYGFCGYDDIDNAKKFVRSDKPNKKTGMYGKYVPLDKEVITFCKHLYETCGIMNNLDVLRSKCSRFFVHADDNEIWTKGTASKSRKFSSEYYTFDRVCEIVFNYLVKIGRINPSDEKFRELMRIPDEHLSQWDKEHGYLYKFHDGKNLAWDDIRDNALTWCMHEG